MGNWTAGEVLGFDFETTGVDRFGDVPVSFALVTVVAGAVVETAAGLVNPGREIPAGATNIHGISTERARDEGMPLRDAVEMVTEAVLSASRRGVPVAGMKLDYDLTILDTQSRRFTGIGLSERGWGGPVLDAVVLDRHLDRFRKGSRTLGSLCDFYGVVLGNAHDASADAVASVQVLLALAARYKELRDADLVELHEAQIRWHRDWATSYDQWRSGEGMAPIDPRDYVWPVAPYVVTAA
ncbi:MAG TPA: exonuclease domain-containing protein [Acidimicrobiales bacterium]|jgi:DNA polymerase-3 subunit epsilon|nr:exonuclease domain-containing protein [Acidimicrobiales bacterium]